MWHVVSTNAFLTMSYQNFDHFHQNVHMKLTQKKKSLNFVQLFWIKFYLFFMLHHNSNIMTFTLWCPSFQFQSRITLITNQIQELVLLYDHGFHIFKKIQKNHLYDCWYFITVFTKNVVSLKLEHVVFWF